MKIAFQLPLIAVRDVARSKRFYSELFDQKVTFDFGENVTFSGGFAIQQDFARLTGIPASSVNKRANNMELYFETDNLKAFMQRAENWPEIEYLHPPQTCPWQQRVVRLYDPDGHLIEVGEAMEMVIRRCLKEGHTTEETAVLTQHPLDFVLKCREPK